MEENREFENTINTPSESNAAEVQPEAVSEPVPEPVPEPAKKGTKNFTEEEKALIAERANKIDLGRVAKEFNTTWQTVFAIQRAAQRKAKIAKGMKTAERLSRGGKRIRPAASLPPVLPIPGKIRKSKDFTPEEREALLARAKEIGIVRAAEEAGTTKWIITEWRRGSRSKKNLAEKAAAKAETQNEKMRAGRGRPPKAVKPETVSAPTPAPAPVADPSESSLSIENAILKEKVVALTQQLEKLRGAIGQLA